MDFELSGDQLALRDAARDLLDAQASPDRVRAHVASGEPYDPKLWRAVVDQGWMGIAVPEDRGGLGLGMVEVAVVAEEVGRHVAPVPFGPSVLALSVAPGDWAERLVAGEAVGCVAWGGLVEADGDVLSGRPEPVVGGPGADVCVVCTGDAAWLVELDEAVRPSPEPAMDLTRSLGWLSLDRTPAVRLGGPDAAVALADRAAALTSAELLGASARALEMATAYAKERVQFGRAIGSFQAVKHRCADMLVDVEGMRSAVYYAAWCLAAGHPDASLAASTAKAWCADAARRVMGSALQVHGGIGFTWEHDLHLYMKRAQLDGVAFGDATWHRDRIAALLRPRVAAGESVV
jgi:alkylation response protein AidB-like acyl-CoA dehydrogenase